MFQLARHGLERLAARSIPAAQPDLLAPEFPALLSFQLRQSILSLLPVLLGRLILSGLLARGCPEFLVNLEFPDLLLLLALQSPR